MYILSLSVFSFLNRNLDKCNHKIYISILLLSPALLFFKSLILSLNLLQTEFDSAMDSDNKIFLLQFCKIRRSKPLNMVILDPHVFNGAHPHH